MVRYGLDFAFSMMRLNEVLALRQSTRLPNRRLLLWTGAAGLLLYLVFQVVPELVRVVRDHDDRSYMAKAEAEAAAVRFAEERLGGSYEPAGSVHQIQTNLYGYLSREDLGKQYEERFDPLYPVETWQVELHGDEGVVLFVHVHMRTGVVVAWNEVAGPGFEPEFGPASLAARAFAIEHGYEERELRLRDEPEDGAVVFDVADRKIGEARLKLRVGVREDGEGSFRVATFKPEFELPEEFTQYVERQDRIASILNLAGYMGLSFVLFVIAIIYAALMRERTSFKRGLLLSGIFLVFYQISNFNMFNGLRASAGEIEDSVAVTVFLTVFQVLFTIGIALSVWFAFVGGDGLWRSMGYKLWLRRGERGFGADAWRAVKIGYCAAFAMLGLQAVIFLVLERGLGVWYSADVTQSMLNFRWPLLFPLLAWCAAISEEAMYRLFGVGLFRKWFRNTAAACIIPTVVWALGHVAYPVYPWSTRLIELTIIGLLFCWLFVRYGFATALFTHAIFDLVLMATSLMFMGGADAILAGVFYIVHPIGVAWLIHRWDRRWPAKPAAPALVGPAAAAVATPATPATPAAPAALPAADASEAGTPGASGSDTHESGTPEPGTSGSNMHRGGLPESGASGSDAHRGGLPESGASGSDAHRGGLPESGASGDGAHRGGLPESGDSGDGAYGASAPDTGASGFGPHEAGKLRTGASCDSTNEASKPGTGGAGDAGTGPSGSNRPGIASPDY